MGNTSMVMRAILVGFLAIVVIAIPNSGPVLGQGGTWTTKASMPTPRFYLGAGVVNGTLYAVGGRITSDTGPSVGTVEAYGPATDTWTTKASMPTARDGLAAGVVNGILYAVGGCPSGCNSSNILNSVEAYDPLTNTWTSKAPMPTARRFLAVGVATGILYAVGGNIWTANLTTLEAYNPLTNTWTAKASMPTNRQSLAVGVVNGILYALGGVNFNNITLNTYVPTVEAYDPLTDSWTTKASMPTPRAGLVVGVVNGILYAVGGGNNSGYLTTVEAYDPLTNMWTTVSSMPTPRCCLAAGVADGIVYAVGGANSSPGFLGTNEAFAPTLEACPPSGQGECEQAEGEGNVDDGAGGNGDFSFIVRRPSTTQQISGFFQYVNRTSGAQVSSVSFSSFAIVGNTATFAGPCMENGAPCAYVVSVAAPLPNSPASFTITISGSTKVGGTLRAGNILVQVLK